MFKILPNVEYVEHTHGKDEFGADIVIAKRDDVFSVEEYVGVIVKTGKFIRIYLEFESKSQNAI